MLLSGDKSSHGSREPQETSNLLYLTIETLNDMTTADLHSFSVPWVSMLPPSRLFAVRSLHTSGCFLTYQVRDHWFPNRAWHTGILENFAELNQPVLVESIRMDG